MNVGGVNKRPTLNNIGSTLNDSVIIMGANSNKKEPNQQRKSIQSIVNQAFDDVVYLN